MIARLKPGPRILAIGPGEARWSCLEDPAFRASIPFLTRLESKGICGTTLAENPSLTFPMGDRFYRPSASAHGIFASVRPGGQGLYRTVLP